MTVAPRSSCDGFATILAHVEAVLKSEGWVPPITPDPGQFSTGDNKISYSRMSATEAEGQHAEIAVSAVSAVSNST